MVSGLTCSCCCSAVTKSVMLGLLGSKMACCFPLNATVTSMILFAVSLIDTNALINDVMGWASRPFPGKVALECQLPEACSEKCLAILVDSDLTCN